MEFRPIGFERIQTLPQKLFFACLFLIVHHATLVADPGVAREKDSTQSAKADPSSDPVPQYLLQYRFEPDEVIRTKVIHQASVRTTIEGSSQTASTVSISVKRWQVVGIDEQGRITFEHSVDYVDMKNEVTGRETVVYDSRTDKEPPPGFEDVAKRVNIPLTRVVMDQSGKVLKREELAAGSTSVSQLAVPLPEKKVSIGQSWSFPDDLVVQLQDGSSRKIKCRQRFELLGVDGGIASIGVATQILTPIKDFPEIQAQLIQRESEGTIQFDMKTGRVVGQLIDLDRRVTGYPNAKSTMHYRTRFTETLLGDGELTAERTLENKPSKK